MTGSEQFQSCSSCGVSTACSDQYLSKVVQGRTVVNQQPALVMFCWETLGLAIHVDDTLHRPSTWILLQTMCTLSWKRYSLMAVASFRRIMRCSTKQKVFKNGLRNTTASLRCWLGLKVSRFYDRWSNKFVKYCIPIWNLHGLTYFIITWCEQGLSGKIILMIIVETNLVQMDSFNLHSPGNKLGLQNQCHKPEYVQKVKVGVCVYL